MPISGAPKLQLRRVLGFRTVLSTSVGLAYAAISFLGCILVATALVGDGAWLAILIAGALALLAATCFAELNALYPSAAAIRLYMKEAFNAKISLIISFAYLLTVVAVIAADSYVVGSAVTYALNLPRAVTLVLILSLLALAALANLRGIRIAGILQPAWSAILGSELRGLQSIWRNIGLPMNIRAAATPGICPQASGLPMAVRFVSR